MLTSSLNMVYITSKRKSSRFSKNSKYQIPLRITRFKLLDVIENNLQNQVISKASLSEC